jgi:hypothetical protein
MGNKKKRTIILTREKKNVYGYDRTELNNWRRSTVNLFEKNWLGNISFVVDVGSSCSWRSMEKKRSCSFLLWK